MFLTKRIFFVEFFVVGGEEEYYCMYLIYSGKKWLKHMILHWKKLEWMFIHIRFGMIMFFFLNQCKYFSILDINSHLKRSIISRDRYDPISSTAIELRRSYA